MKFTTIASTLILASSTLAAPFSHIRQARHLRRATNANANANSTATTRKTVPPKYVTLETSSASNNSNVEYSENWAGAVLIGTSFTSVTGTFTVPTPTSEGSGSAWVGIDGDTCDTAILQTGVDWTYSRESVSYDAWYEWYPDYAYDFSGITISAGDSITVTVTATSSTSGTAVLENTTTGTTVTHTFSNEASLGSLCEYNAEWIVEDFEEDESLVDFADFGTATFTDCSATDSSGTVGVEDATIIDIEQNNEVLTDCSVSGDSEVICTYVG